ncbi:MAG TPA: TlpA disulfide reductase family protein, partial [Gemmataceae bacterium]|nr:TlpA disulfide reductase family protein [Gemmataceae bacterium]
MMLTIFGMVLPWVLVALGCWLVFQLIRQNGRILGYLEELQQQVQGLMGDAAPESAAAPPAGLPAGEPAPDFELPDLAGKPHKLSEYSGKQLLLFFFNPQCGFCMQMLDDLAALPVDGEGGKPIPLVISTGDAEQNRKVFEEHKVRCPVLLQHAMDVATQYQVSGTPVGYLIDEEGNIASGQAIGSVALLGLANQPVAGADDQEANGSADGTNGESHAMGKANRGLAASRIKRDGLKAGTPAPAFRLPRLDGGELALED